MLHIFLFLRHAGVLEMAVQSMYNRLPDPEKGALTPGEQKPKTEDITVSLTHDLSMLRIIETFSESAPQLTLMLTIILQTGHLDPVTGAVLHFYTKMYFWNLSKKNFTSRMDWIHWAEPMFLNMAGAGHFFHSCIVWYVWENSESHCVLNDLSECWGPEVETPIGMSVRFFKGKFNKARSLGRI